MTMSTTPSEPTVPVINQDALLNERTQLISDVAQMQNDAADIKAQLARASSQYFHTGERADPRWFSSASTARRAKLQQVLVIQSRLTEIGRLLGIVDKRSPGLRAKQEALMLQVCREALRLVEERDILDDGLEAAMEALDDAMPDWDSPDEAAPLALHS